MSEFGKIQSFIETMKYGEVCASRKCLEEGLRPFVTISRQTGAGGHRLAEAILDEIERLQDRTVGAGWKLFDHELCKMMTEETGLKVSLQSLMEQEYHSQVEDMVTQLIAGNSPQDAVVKKMFQIMRTLATFEKVILVGHGGACLTRSLSRGIHLRLVSPLETRVARMTALLGTNERRTREIIQERDKGRAALIKTFFNRDINDPLLYDAVWNTENVPLRNIARYVIAMIQSKTSEISGLKLVK